MASWKNLGGAQRRKETPAPVTSCQAPRFLVLESILVERFTWHQERPQVRSNMSQARWLARDNPETKTFALNTETESHSSPGFPYLLLSAQVPLPSKVSGFVFPQMIHFWVLDKSPLLGPGRTPPSCNHVIYHVIPHPCPTLSHASFILRWRSLSASRPPTSSPPCSMLHNNPGDHSLRVCCFVFSFQSLFLLSCFSLQVFLLWTNSLALCISKLSWIWAHLQPGDTQRNSSNSRSAQGNRVRAVLLEKTPKFQSQLSLIMRSQASHSTSGNPDLPTSQDGCTT